MAKYIFKSYKFEKKIPFFMLKSHLKLIDIELYVL